MIESLLISLAAICLVVCGCHITYTTAGIYGDKIVVILGVIAGFLTFLLGVAMLALAWSGT